MSLTCSGAGTAKAWVNFYTVIEVYDLTTSTDHVFYDQIWGTPITTCASSTFVYSWPSANTGFTGYTTGTHTVSMTKGDSISLRMQMGCEAYVQITSNVAGMSADANCGNGANAPSVAVTSVSI